MYLVRKDLLERQGVLDAGEVRWYLDPVAEAIPFPPSCGVLVELGRGESFDDSCVCSIVCSRHLAEDSRRHILQGKIRGKVERKCLRKSRMGRWVSRNAGSGSWLSIPVILSIDV